MMTWRLLAALAAIVLIGVLAIMIGKAIWFLQGGDLEDDD